LTDRPPPHIWILACATIGYRRLDSMRVAFGTRALYEIETTRMES